MAKPSRSKDLLDFEIAFYEKLIQQYPQFIDALMALGEAYTRRGWHDKGLAIDQRLVELRGSDPVIWYNLACSLSLLKRLDDALDALRRSVTLGYDDFEYLRMDPDLESLRRSPEFRRFLESLSTSQRQ